MSPMIDIVQNTVVEELLAEFNEGLRCEGTPHFEILERCPEPQRRELLSLMNVAAMAFRALEPERKAFRDVKEVEVAVEATPPPAAVLSARASFLGERGMRVALGRRRISLVGRATPAAIDSRRVTFSALLPPLH